MKLQDENIDFTTLNWVKQELDETLKQARQSLEAYVEDPADSSLMRFCATYLHQVQGTLRMVELYGAAMVVEEMERVALALLDGQIKAKDDSYSVLMRGIVQLPDYLERLQSGHKDIPIVLLPLLNDLRATRGEKLLTESVLFSPDLSAPLPSAAGGAAQATPELELKAEAARLRSAFQLSLLRWIRDDSASAQLTRLIEMLDRLRTACSQEDACRLWWVAAGVLEGVASGAVEANAAVKLLFGKVDREIKRLVDTGEAGFRVSPPSDLTKNLLFYIAHSDAAGERATAIRATYKLDTLLPSEKELEHAKGSISGHNRSLLDTVSVAIKDDLMRVKEALDIFLRAQNPDPTELMAQVDALDRVGDTLGMLGLGVPRRVVTEQRKVVEEMANKSRPADETTLLDVAGALLYVEASLDDHIDRLGADAGEQTGGGPGSQGLELPKAEARKILDALMKEASANIGQAKQDIVAFIESPWDHSKVEPIPALLDEIAGALRILDLNDAAQLMKGIVRFIQVELLRHRRVPTAEQMDKLADALASIEYYLEATHDQRGGRERILDVTRQSLTALGYWPVPPDDGGGDGLPIVPPLPVQAAAARAPATSTTAAAFTAPPAAPPTSPAAIAMADAHQGDYPRWGEDLPASGEAGLKPDASAAENPAEMPSIELTDESIDEYIARMDKGEESPAHAEPAPTHEHAIEIEPAVDVAPGRGLEDLVVGELPATESPAHDLAGLRLIETQATATPVPNVRYVEVEEEIEEEVADADGAAVTDASFAAVRSDDIDEEIREVFVEEVQDEIDNLGRCLPVWKADVHDFEKLKPIRRSFHTLKGSGRLVGALALGEFSWKVENMLNRVLDKTIPPGQPVLALVETAIGTLPELLRALRGEGNPTADIGQIMAVADRVAAGEDAYVRSSAPARTKRVKRIVKRLVAVVDETPPAAAPAELSATVDIEHAFDAAPEEVAALAGGDVAEQAAYVAGPLPNVDPVLFEILKSEVAAHLAAIDGYLVDWRATPSLPVSEPLLRAVHTLNGAIAMVDIPAITHVLAPLEGYTKRLRAGNRTLDKDGAAALGEASALVRDCIAALETLHPQMPDSGALAARIAELRDRLPEPEMMHVLFSEAHAHEMPPAPEPVATEATPHDDEAALLAELGALESEARAEAEMPKVAETSAVADADDETARWLREFEQAQAAETHAPVEEAALAAIKPTKPVESPETELLSFEDLPAQAEIPAPVELEHAEPEPVVAEPALIIEAVASEPEPAVEPEIPVHEPTPPAAVAAIEPAPALPESSVTLPPLLDDPQPDGKLELPDLDEDLLEIFVQEGADILDHSDALMAKLREAPQDRELITGLQRDLHTLKGGARMAGLAPIGDLSHAMESLFEAISDNRHSVNRITIESLERGFDRLHGLVQRVARHQAVAMPEHAIARFEGLVSGELPVMPAAVSAVPAAPAVAATPSTAAAAPAQRRTGGSETFF